jgi:hypothetical protein
MQGDQWFLVKLAGVNRLAVFNSSRDGAMKENVADERGKENNLSIRKVGWLSRQSEKLCGSAVIFHVERTDADKILLRGAIGIARETAYTTPFERRPRLAGCFAC